MWAASSSPWLVCDPVGGFFYFVYLTCLSFPVGTRRTLDLSDYHTLTVSGGGRLLVDRRGVGTTRCREGTTFAGCLPGVSTDNKCVHDRGRLSVLDSTRGKTLSKLNADLDKPLRRTTRIVTRLRPRLTNRLPTLKRDLMNTLSNTNRSLISTFHASAHGVCTNTLALARPLCVNNGVHTCGGVAGCTRRLTHRRRGANVRRMVLDASRTC